MATKKKALQAAAGNAGGEALAIEDVFSTYLYSYESNPQTINNGIDLAGEGGLIVTKNRVNATDWKWVDTERSGLNKALTSSDTNPEDTDTGGVLSVTSSGYTLGTNSNYNSTNTANRYASWTFRKAPRFFDVVTWTGDGTSNRAIPHNLGTTVGAIFVKKTSSVANWRIYHASQGIGKYAGFSTSAFGTYSGFWTSAPDDSNFYIGSDAEINGSGATYIAYLFAHDPLGPSGDGSDGLIACGSYTGTGAAGNQITLGWEPQWLLVKNTSTGGQNWEMFDNMRGVATGGIAAELFPNTSAAERAAFNLFNFNATGFATESTLDETNASGDTYIYIAIRRGPMRQPTSGTEVFSVKNYAATNTFAEVTHDVTFDTEINANRDVAITKFLIRDSLRDINGKSLITSSTNAETAAYPTYWSRKDQRTMYAISSFDGWWAASSGTNNHISYGLVRAPGFFDVVAYTGNSTAGRTVPHNLGVAPEMMIVKKRDGVDSWRVYHSGLNGGTTPQYYFVNLNNTNAEVANSAFWNNTAPASTEFTVGTNVNGSGAYYIAYLFATLPGVSKVGNYTGDGTNGQIINCGFTSGARFVLIKRTDSTGPWYVYDSARGIVSGNDPRLQLQDTAAEATSVDEVDPHSSGFIVNNDPVNYSGASYIFLAIA